MYSSLKEAARESERSKMKSYVSTRVKWKNSRGKKESWKDREYWVSGPIGNSSEVCIFISSLFIRTQLSFILSFLFQNFLSFQAYIPFGRLFSLPLHSTSFTSCLFYGTYSFSSLHSLTLFTSLFSGTDLKILRRTGWIYFHFLFLYSGLEYTLCFLTHLRFNYSRFVFWIPNTYIHTFLYKWIRNIHRKMWQRNGRRRRVKMSGTTSNDKLETWKCIQMTERSRLKEKFVYRMGISKYLKIWI